MNELASFMDRRDRWAASQTRREVPNAAPAKYSKSTTPDGQQVIKIVTTCPAGRHDDMADMMSQASAWLLGTDEITVSIVNAFTGRPFD